MPHGAPALHTWKVDMTGESLAGGKKKRKEKNLIGCRHRMPHILYIHLCQSHMVWWDGCLINGQLMNRKTTAHKQKESKKHICQSRIF